MSAFRVPALVLKNFHTSELRLLGIIKCSSKETIRFFKEAQCEVRTGLSELLKDGAFVALMAVHSERGECVKTKSKSSLGETFFKGRVERQTGLLYHFFKSRQPEKHLAFRL